MGTEAAGSGPGPGCEERRSRPGCANGTERRIGADPICARWIHPKPGLQKVMNVLKDLGPDEAEVEFGLKIGGETGVVIAKGTAEVNFVIRMSWKRD
jgi:hypothetical protein